MSTAKAPLGRRGSNSRVVEGSHETPAFCRRGPADPPDPRRHDSLHRRQRGVDQACARHRAARGSKRAGFAGSSRDGAGFGPRRCAEMWELLPPLHFEGPFDLSLPKEMASRRRTSTSGTHNYAFSVNNRGLRRPAAARRGPVPTLVLCRRNDWITPLAKSEEIASRIPGRRLEVFESERPHADGRGEQWFLAFARSFLASGCVANWGCKPLGPGEHDAVGQHARGHRQPRRLSAAHGARRLRPPSDEDVKPGQRLLRRNGVQRSDAARGRLRVRAGDDLPLAPSFTNPSLWRCVPGSAFAPHSWPP